MWKVPLASHTFTRPLFAGHLACRRARSLTFLGSLLEVLLAASVHLSHTICDGSGRMANSVAVLWPCGAPKALAVIHPSNARDARRRGLVSSGWPSLRNGIEKKEGSETLMAVSPMAASREGLPSQGSACLGRSPGQRPLRPPLPPERRLCRPRSAVRRPWCPSSSRAFPPTCWSVMTLTPVSGQVSHSQAPTSSAHT